MFPTRIKQPPSPTNSPTNPDAGNGRTQNTGSDEIPPGSPSSTADERFSRLSRKRRREESPSSSAGQPTQQRPRVASPRSEPRGAADNPATLPPHELSNPTISSLISHRAQPAKTPVEVEIQELPERIFSNSVQKMAYMICEEIRKQAVEIMDFSSMDTVGFTEEGMRALKLPEEYIEASRDALNSDNIKKKYQDSSVKSYIKNKKYPSKKRDLRPHTFDFDNICAHGTNLSSVVSALIHTNKQLTPGIKATKLGVKIKTGQSGGKSLLNQRYVSTVPAYYQDSNLDLSLAEKYSFNSSRKLGGYLESFVLPSDTIQILVLGDGIDRGKVTSGGDHQHERVYKRVNIRVVAIEANHKETVLEILKFLDIKDIRVCTFEDLKIESFQALWDKASVAVSSPVHKAAVAASQQTHPGDPTGGNLGG